jgi:hypothetical protein
MTDLEAAAELAQLKGERILLDTGERVAWSRHERFLEDKWSLMMRTERGTPNAWASVPVTEEDAKNPSVIVSLLGVLRAEIAAHPAA